MIKHYYLLAYFTHTERIIASVIYVKRKDVLKIVENRLGDMYINRIISITRISKKEAKTFLERRAL